MSFRVPKIAATATLATLALVGGVSMAMAFTTQSGTVTAVNPGQDTISINGHAYALQAARAGDRPIRVGEHVYYKVDGYSSLGNVVVELFQAPASTPAAQFAPAPKVTPMPMPRDLSGTAKTRADGNIGAPARVRVVADAAMPNISGEAKQMAAIMNGRG